MPTQRRVTYVCLRHPQGCQGLYTRCRLIVNPSQLRPMRRADGHTKRSIERITKGYVS